jgi:hypothetical protein
MCLFTSAVHAQSTQCLEDLTVTPIGEVTLEIGGDMQTLEFLSISVADFAFGDVENFTSAAYLRDATGANPNFHVWSLTAYPQGYADTLQTAVCGEDVLAAFDDYQMLADLGGLLSGALSSVSPSQAASSALLDAALRREVGDDRMAAITDLRQSIAEFGNRLPNRTGAFHLTLRGANLDANAIMMNLALDNFKKMQLLERLEPDQIVTLLDRPQTQNCPCEMDTVEAHIYGAEGPPLIAQSQSWGLADTRNAPFAATLTSITFDETSGYSITGEFDGAVVAVTPDPDGPNALGMTAMSKGDTFVPVRGQFSANSVMGGNLARLPKVF